ncbi:MAG: phosphonate metabolism transcriptional regulator PhnF [Thalassobaculum sp.]|uniref:phosphonate metabolism transcriptional regulator PhnF n=1 Tax=Thalassobaculum sp. TaxID=2022740 RepID=UPI0032EDF5C6
MAVIDRDSGVAVWRQIEETLAGEIRSGHWAEGVRLPTEADLASRFRVNRHTLRRAIGGLVDRGLVRVEQGRGIFVRENVLEYLIGRRTRFTENVRRVNRAPGGHAIAVDRQRAGREIAGALGIRTGTQVVYLQTVGKVDDRPVSFGEHWFPARLFPRFDSEYRTIGNGSITRLMEAHGFGDYERAVTKVTARMPDATEAELLEQPRARPILYVESLNVAADGTPLQASHVRHAADRFQMVFETRPAATGGFGETG